MNFIVDFIDEQLVCYLKSHAVWLGRICLRCDQLVGLCMVPAWVFWSCMVVLHGVVGKPVLGELFCCTCFQGITCFLGVLFCGKYLHSRGSPGVLRGEGGGTTTDRKPARKRGVSPELSGGWRDNLWQTVGKKERGLPGVRVVPSQSRVSPCSFKVTYCVVGNFIY